MVRILLVFLLAGAAWGQQSPYNVHDYSMQVIKKWCARQKSDPTARKVPFALSFIVNAHDLPHLEQSFEVLCNGSVRARGMSEHDAMLFGVALYLEGNVHADQGPQIVFSEPPKCTDCVLPAWLPPAEILSSSPVVWQDPKPLKCGKYEHVVPRQCVQKTISVGCDEVIDEHCVPDLHTVTEKEWQELMERLKKLESKP